MRCACGSLFLYLWCMDKKELRNHIKELKAAFGDAELQSALVWSRIESLPEFQSADTVLIYHSLPDELDTHAFIERWYGHKHIVLPLVQGDDLLLKEYSPEKLVPGYKGILEPSVESDDVNASAIDFAIVPGVAFDSECRRLGRGRGFYDRLLPSLDCPCAGVCYDFQIVDEVPVNERDQHLSMVVSANYIFRR